MSRPPGAVARGRPRPPATARDRPHKHHSCAWARARCQLVAAIPHGRGRAPVLARIRPGPGAARRREDRSAAQRRRTRAGGPTRLGARPAPRPCPSACGPRAPGPASHRFCAARRCPTRDTPAVGCRRVRAGGGWRGWAPRCETAAPATVRRWNVGGCGWVWAVVGRLQGPCSLPVGTPGAARSRRWAARRSPVGCPWGAGVPPTQRLRAVAQQVRAPTPWRFLPLRCSVRRSEPATGVRGNAGTWGRGR